MSAFSKISKVWAKSAVVVGDEALDPEELLHLSGLRAGVGLELEQQALDLLAVLVGGGVRHDQRVVRVLALVLADERQTRELGRVPDHVLDDGVVGGAALHRVDRDQVARRGNRSVDILRLLAGGQQAAHEGLARGGEQRVGHFLAAEIADPREGLRPLLGDDERLVGRRAVGEHRPRDRLGDFLLDEDAGDERAGEHPVDLAALEELRGLGVVLGDAQLDVADLRDCRP